MRWQPRSREERAEARRRVWRWMAVFSALQVIGKRAGRYKDPDSGEMYDLTSRSELLHISERLDPEQLSFDPGPAARGHHVQRGPWIQQWGRQPPRAELLRRRAQTRRDPGRETLGCMGASNRPGSSTVVAREIGDCDAFITPVMTIS